MMRLFVLVGLLISFALACARDEVSIPKTAPGERLQGFLTAYNSGQRESLRRYFQAHMEAPPNAPNFADEIAGRQMGTFRLTGPLDVRRIAASESVQIRVTVQGRSTGVWMDLTIYVTAKAPEFKVAEAPYRIVGMGLRNVPPPVELLPERRLSEGEIRNRVASLMRKLAANDGFSGVVYVAKDRRPIYRGAFGLASKAWKAPNRVDTKFNLASITKMFTAVAVAQLVEQGKLAYSDPVGKILPDYTNAEVAQKVTVHHLLSHTSGMIGARRLVERGGDRQDVRTVAEMVKPFREDPLEFPPGERFSYSNAGFILLGQIIERASGQTYYDYVREHVFRPAGMTSTDFYALDAETPNLATGYEDGPGGRRSNVLALGAIGSPAGGAYSTAEDLDRFQLALRDGKLLRPASREAMWKLVSENDPGAGYGYGAQVSHYNGYRVIGHGGGWRGITNQFEFYPELGYTVVVLSNYDVEPGLITDLLRGWLTQGVPAP